MAEPELLDAIGVPLKPGQRVVYATAGIHATGILTPGTITRVAVAQKAHRVAERITIQRMDGRRVTIGWSKRVLVLRQESEADGWLRRQLALLGAR
jgi:hypothetical protein